MIKSKLYEDPETHAFIFCLSIPAEHVTPEMEARRAEVEAWLNETAITR